MIWFTSDQHYGHDAIIEFCQRPFENVAAMDAELIRRHNSAVKPDDTVYVLGDMFFHNAARSKEIASQLNGKIVLVQGNHDKHSRKQYTEDMGFTLVNECVLEILGRRIRLSHFPYWPDTDQEPHVQKKELRFKNLRPTKAWGGEFLLCGHVHQWWKTQGRMINVGVDVWNYLPISVFHVEQVISDLERRERLGSTYALCYNEGDNALNQTPKEI